MLLALFLSLLLLFPVLVFFIPSLVICLGFRSQGDQELLELHLNMFNHQCPGRVVGWVWVGWVVCERGQHGYMVSRWKNVVRGERAKHWWCPRKCNDPGCGDLGYKTEPPLTLMRPIAMCGCFSFFLQCLPALNGWQHFHVQVSWDGRCEWASGSGNTGRAWRLGLHETVFVLRV